MSNNNPRDNEQDETEEQVDPTVREAVEQLDSYKDYLRESRGDSLTYGDY